MVQEDQNRLIINDVLKLSADISVLYLNTLFSDVFLVVEEDKLPAHKVILAARSKFFENLLFGSEQQQSKKEHILTGITCDTLKKLLKYIYTGIISVESTHVNTDLEILGLASQYHLEDLQIPLISKINKLLDKENVFTILDMANMYNLEELTKTCNSFLDTHAWELKSHDSFTNLSQVSMVNLLKRDTFVLPEIDIFNIVGKWRKSNTDLDDLVINCVRFGWMSVVEVVSNVWPAKILPCEQLLSAIAEIVNVKPKTKTRRVQAEFDKNLATAKYNSKVTTGNNSENLLNGNRDVTKYCSHAISNKAGITVELGSTYLINNIVLKLYDKDIRHYMYYIETSRDGKNWMKILDYSTYACRSDQNLYFDSIITKFIRIVGTHSTIGSVFHLIYFEAFYRLTVPRLVKDVVVPTVNVALEDKKAIVIEGGGGNFIINGDFTKYNGSTGFSYHTIGSGSIIIELAQPYMISTMKLRLWDSDARFYKFYVETSTNKSNWEMAIDRRNQECKSWQQGTFSERVTVFIKITGTQCSVNDGFHCVYLECPSSPSTK